MTGTRLLLLAWAVMSFADGHTVGTYTPLSVALMTAGVALLSVPALASGRFPLTAPSRLELGAALLVLVALYPVATIAPANESGLGQVAAMILLGLGTALALLSWSRRAAVLGGTVGVLSCVVAGAVMINRNADPHVDVLFLTQGAADSIVHGFDMYLGHWASPHGIRDGFPYLPGVGLILAPFRLVGLDVRYGLLLATAAAAVLMWRIAPRPLGPWHALLVFAVPGWPTLVAFAWTEPLLLLPLLLVFLFVRNGRPTWAVVAFAIALCTKQHVLLLCPVLAAWPAFGLRRVCVAGGAASLVILPWFLVGPHSFLDGALWLNLRLEPRRDSLSLFTSAIEQGWHPPFALVGAVTVFALTLAVLVLRRHATPPLVALACAWVLAVFHLVNKQSFYNEWWLVITLVVVALAFAPEAEKARATL